MNKIHTLVVVSLFFLFAPSVLTARYIHKSTDNYFVCIHIDQKSKKLITVDKICKTYNKNEEFFAINRSHIVLPYDIKDSVTCKNDKKDIRCKSIFFTVSKSETTGYTTGQILALPFFVVSLPLYVIHPKGAVDLTKKTINGFATTIKYFNKNKFKKFITKNHLLRFQGILKKEAEVVKLYPNAKREIDQINLNDNTKNIENKIANIKKEFYTETQKLQLVLRKVAIFKKLYPFAKNPLKDIDANDSLKNMKSYINTVEKKLKKRKKELIAKAKREKKIQYIKKENKKIKKLYPFAKDPLKDININDNLKNIKHQISSIEKKLIAKKNALKKKKNTTAKKTKYIICKRKTKSTQKNEKTSQINHIHHKTIKKENNNSKNDTTLPKNHNITFGNYLLKKLPLFFIILFVVLYFVSPKKITEKRYSNNSNNSNNSNKKYYKKENHSKQSYHSNKEDHKKKDHSKQSNNTNTNSIEYACLVLGISISDDKDSIKKRYKKLIFKYHPDIVAGKGLDKDSIKEATRKIQEINNAYAIIKKYKNIR